MEISQPYSLANLQTNFLFGSSEASELRLMFFGFKPAVLGGDRYEYKHLTEEQAPKNLRGAFAIIRATDEYPHIELTEYLESSEGLVDGVAFDPKLEQIVLDKYQDIFIKLGYEITRPTNELVREIFQSDDGIGISLALGYSLGSAIFFNIHEHPSFGADETSKKLWNSLEKILDKDQIIAAQDIAKQFLEGLPYQDLAKKLSLSSRHEDHYKRFREAWELSGLASILDSARRKFYSPKIYNGMKDLF